MSSFTWIILHQRAGRWAAEGFCDSPERVGWGRLSIRPLSLSVTVAVGSIWPVYLTATSDRLYQPFIGFPASATPLAIHQLHRALRAFPRCARDSRSG